VIRVKKVEMGENMRKKKRKLKKGAITLTVATILFVCCVIIQVFFMPKWENGNTNVNSASSNGVHTQKGADFEHINYKQKIHITN